MKRKKGFLHDKSTLGLHFHSSVFILRTLSSSYTYFQNWMIRKFKTTESDIYISRVQRATLSSPLRVALGRGSLTPLHHPFLLLLEHI